MATGYMVPPILRLKRSTQSGNYTMTIAWQTVYSQNHPFAWIFGSGKIDLTNMIAGDHIEVRISSRNTSGGGYVVEDLFDYDDVQPTGKKKISIGTIVDTFGVLVEIRQTVGVPIVCACEFYDATR